MASNNEYEQQEFFEYNMTQEELVNRILQDIIRNRNLKEKFKKAFLYSSITGEYKVEI